MPIQTAKARNDARGAEGGAAAAAIEVVGSHLRALGAELLGEFFGELCAEVADDDVEVVEVTEEEVVDIDGNNLRGGGNGGDSHGEVGGGQWAAGVHVARTSVEALLRESKRGNLLGRDGKVEYFRSVRRCGRRSRA